MPQDWLTWVNKYPDQGHRWIKEHPNYYEGSKSNPIPKPIDPVHIGGRVVYTPPLETTKKIQHEDNKTAIITTSIAIGIGVVLVYNFT